MTSPSTATPENPSVSAPEVEEVLRSVMQSLTDSEEGFQRLGEELRDPGLRRYFLEESSMRAQFLTELEAVLLNEGIEDNKESGTVAGALHRAWGKLKSALGGGVHSLLVAAEQGEDEVNKAYQRAFEIELPFSLQQLLTAQAWHVQVSHDYIRAACDITR